MLGFLVYKMRALTPISQGVMMIKWDNIVKAPDIRQKPTHRMALIDGRVMIFLWTARWHMWGEDAHVGWGWPGELFMSQINRAAKKEAQHPRANYSCAPRHEGRDGIGHSERERSAGPWEPWGQGDGEKQSAFHSLRESLPDLMGETLLDQCIRTHMETPGLLFTGNNEHAPLPLERPCWLRNALGRIKSPLTIAVYKSGLPAWNCLCVLSLRERTNTIMCQRVKIHLIPKRKQNLGHCFPFQPYLHWLKSVITVICWCFQNSWFHCSLMFSFSSPYILLVFLWPSI